MSHEITNVIVALDRNGDHTAMTAEGIMLTVPKGLGLPLVGQFITVAALTPTL